jgi:hypothetical protein
VARQRRGLRIVQHDEIVGREGVAQARHIP